MSLHRFFTVLIFTVFSFYFSQAQVAKQMSSSEIELELEKLNTVGSVLYIAAHPDDENTRLLSYLANERKVRTAYLSLTRGDGGQNLIGNEQSELLGMIRTQELLEARKIDGAEQFFSRANDFGFSKTPEETLEKWGRENILEDVVFIIRAFKPDVIITRFPTTGEGGHGHHTASAILAIEAFDAAADPKRFPDQVKLFGTWQAKRIVWNTFNFAGRNTTDSTQLKMSINNFNPLLGKSYGELAAESRSMHKSQGFGSSKQRGEILEYFKPLKGDKAQNDLLEGVGLTWSSVENGAKINELLKKAITAYQQKNTNETTSLLLNALSELEKIKNKQLAEYKRKKIIQLLLSINGVWLETLSDRVNFAENDSILFTTNFVKRIENNTSFIVKSIYYLYHTDTVVNTTLNSKLNQVACKVNVDKSFLNYSNPFWLNTPKTENNFIYPKKYTGLPELDNCNVNYTLQVNDKTISFEQKIQYKNTDPVDGEKYKDVLHLPAVSVNMESSLYIFSENKTAVVKVALKNNVASTSGIVKIKAPEGYTISPAEHKVDFKSRDEEKTVEFTLTKTGKSLNDNTSITAEFITTANQSYNQSVVLINHDHIKNLVRIQLAQAKIISLDLKTISKNIGYIEGAGDDVKECLTLLNYTTEELTSEKIKNYDLSKFDAIVVGIRAYNTHEWLKLYYDKLMKYVENGGNLIVQYNTNNFISNVKSEIGPYPFKISRERVTLENAAMKFLQPDHAILNYPNKLSEKDFDNWVQERGIYFVTDIDKKYTPIFSCADPNEKEQNGSLIVTNYGKGNFVYTGLAFFRQLPAGVPGAYRLFVNCLEYGKK